MLTAKKVKEYAKRCGADIVGIASMDRFEGAPKQFDPRYIFPDAKSMVVMGFRIFRGCLRGIEEGTFFVAYAGMGYAGINWVYQPVVLWNFCKMLEDEGYEAVPVPNNFPWSSADAGGQLSRHLVGAMELQRYPDHVSHLNRSYFMTKVDKCKVKDHK